MEGRAPDITDITRFRGAESRSPTDAVPSLMSVLLPSQPMVRDGDAVVPWDKGRVVSSWSCSERRDFVPSIGKAGWPGLTEHLGALRMT